MAGPVWRHDEKRWRCVAHDSATCNICYQVVQPPPTGKPGNVVLADGVGENGAPVNPKLICPHCQTRGEVSTMTVSVKEGISGGKATAAVLTAGLGVAATGLSRKNERTECSCGNCGMTWLV